MIKPELSRIPMAKARPKSTAWWEWLIAKTRRSAAQH